MTVPPRQGAVEAARPAQALAVSLAPAPYPFYLYEQAYEDRRKRALAATVQQAMQRITDLIQNEWDNDQAVAYVRDSGCYSAAAREEINKRLGELETV